MDKIDFINKLLNHFDVSDFIFQTEIEKYSNGLLDNIDFLKLIDYVENYITLRPTSIELNRIATVQKFLVDKKKDPASMHFEYIKRTASTEPLERILSEESKEKIRNMLAKYGKKPAFDN